MTTAQELSEVPDELYWARRDHIAEFLAYQCGQSIPDAKWPARMLMSVVQEWINEAVREAKGEEA